MRDAQQQFHMLGIETGGPITHNFTKMQKAKAANVLVINSHISGLLTKYGVTRKIGWGKFASPNDIEIKNKNGETEIITAKNIIIATGSEPNSLTTRSGLIIDNKYICDSTGALE